MERLFSIASCRRLVLYAVALLFAVLAPSRYLSASGNEPLAVVENGKYGYIDHDGKIVIRPQFIWAEDFWRGLGTVYVCGRYLSIDSSGNLFPLRIAAEGQLEPKKHGDKYGFVDASGEFKIAPRFDDALPFSDGLAAFAVGKKWGFIDRTGKAVIPPQFEQAYYFREGAGYVEVAGGSAFIDKSGNVIASNVQSLDSVSEGRIPVMRGDKHGYLDLSGRVVVPFVYDEARSFSTGLAAVENHGKWGYIDREGRAVIPFKFDTAGQFASDLAPVTLGEKSGYINSHGEFAFLLPFRDSPGFLTGDEESNLFIAESDVARFWTADHKFGYVNTSGQIIWGPIEGDPTHPPLLGWTASDDAKSCEGVPDTVRAKIATFSDR